MGGYILRAILVALLLFSESSVASDTGAFVPAEWDRALPSMELKGVALEGDRMDRVWGKLGHQYFIRSNLYMEDFEEGAPFRFEADSCKAGELLDAVTAHFGYVWTRAPESGVIWIHPNDVEFEDILADQVKIGREYVGIPLLTGVVEQVRRVLPPGTVVAGRWSEFLVAAGDQPVCISAGSYSMREVLDVCSQWSPSKAFAVFHDTGLDVLEISSLRDEVTKGLPPGARLFWELNIGPLAEGEAPSDDDIGRALAAPEMRVRWASRMYLRMGTTFENTEQRMRRRIAGLSYSEQAAWEIIGFHAFRHLRPDRSNWAEDSAILDKFSRPHVSKQFSADAEFLLHLTYAAIHRLEAAPVNLERLGEVNVSNVLFDLLRLSYVMPGITAQFFDKGAAGYVGDRLKGLPDIPHKGYHKHPPDFSIESYSLSGDIVHPNFPRIEVSLVAATR